MNSRADDSSPPRQRIYISGETWIMAIPLRANGPTQPVSLLIGEKTGLNAGLAVYVDSNFDSFMTHRTNDGAWAVSAFNDTLNGNMPPSAILTGPDTRLDNPWGFVVIDEGDFHPAPFLCVVNRPVSSPAAANLSFYASIGGGDQRPSRQIVGPNTRLNRPMALTHGPSLSRPAKFGLIYVTQELAPRIVAFPVDGVGNVAPDHILDGPQTNLDTVRGKVAFDANGKLYVCNTHASEVNPAVLIFPAGASGNASPVRAITGSQTGLQKLHDLALDQAGNIYVLSQAPDNTVHVLVYAAGSTGNVAPARIVDPPIQEFALFSMAIMEESAT